MRHRGFQRSLLVGLCVLLVGCRGAVGGASSGQGGPPGPQTPKRITMMIKVEPTVIAGELGSSGGGNVMGANQLNELLHSGLSVVNGAGQRIPHLATAIPTVENGLWKVLSDGRMEMTWKLNPGARWHDGTTLTSADLLFTMQVKQDRELPFASIHVLWGYIESAMAPDPQTVTVTYKITYVNADQLFSWTVGLPLPKHILEPPYRDQKDAFMTLPYWNDDYVGAGPFKMKEWMRGSHYVVAANADYLLGRPKLDEVKVIFVADAPIMASSLLSGAADLSTSNLNVPLETAVELRDRWTAGNVIIEADHAFWVWPQFLYSNPPIVGSSLQFRRAMYQALDRQTMGTAFNLGLPTSVSDALVGPNDPSYKLINAAVPHYGYDPRRAEQAVTELGYQRGGDGLFRDRSGELLR